MQDKQIYELTKLDLENHPVWFFPMDESVEDEATVRPCLNSIDDNFQIIVAANFQTIDGSIFSGYVYYDLSTGGIEHVKPVIFFGKNIITFWNGMIKPSWIDYPKEIQEIKRSLPIRFRSRQTLGLSTIEGTLEGLYYIDESNKINYL